MTLSVCPAATVAAPASVVWDALSEPARWGEWIDGRVVSVTPPGPVTVGQVFTVASPALGREWRSVFTVELVDSMKRQLGFQSIFPLGLRLNQRLTCAPIDAVSCRVQYG